LSGKEQKKTAKKMTALYLDFLFSENVLHHYP